MKKKLLASCGVGSLAILIAALSSGAMAVGDNSAAQAASHSSTDRSSAARSASMQPAWQPPVRAMAHFSADDFTLEAAGVPASLADAVDRDLGIPLTRFLSEGAAAVAAVATVDSLRAAGVTVFGSRIDGAALTVFVRSNADAAQVRSTGALAVKGQPSKLDLSGVTFTRTADLSGGSGYIWPKPGGGGSYSQCSVGFNGFASNTGANRFVTAGHCVIDAAAVNINALVQSAPGNSGSLGEKLGTFVSGSAIYGSGYDGALVAVTEAAARPMETVQTWGGGAGAPQSSAPITVVGNAAGIVGANLCKSGSRTGWTCGKISAVDTTVTEGGTGRTINSIIASTCVLPGDSGGSAAMGQWAVGIASMTSNSSACDGNSFGAFFPMISSAGRASITSQYGTTWETKVAVSAPVVTAAQSGTTGTPGSLSGTLQNASAGSSVHLYVDGSSQASAVVDASSGKWSVTLPITASGSHSYRLVASWQSWSLSANTSGTFTVSNTSTASTTSSSASSESAAPSPSPKPAPSPSSKPAPSQPSAPAPTRSPQPAPSGNPSIVRELVGGLFG